LVKKWYLCYNEVKKCVLTSFFMAKTLTLPEMQAQSAALDREEAALSGKTGADSGFYSSTMPTSSALSTDIAMRDLATRKAKLQSQIQSANLYGLNTTGDVTTTSEPKQGIIAKGVDILSRPLYGVVGAAKYLTGQGKSTLGESVMSNVNTDKQTFGSLLRNVGAPPLVSMPLGFAMDVIADPVNLMSGGMAGLERSTVGKVVKGAVTSPEAFSEAVKLGGSKALYNLTRLVPGLSVDKAMADKIAQLAKAGVAKDSPEFADAIARVYKPTDSLFSQYLGKARVVKENLAKTVAETSDRYDTLTNWNLNNILEARAINQSVTDQVGQMVRNSSPQANRLLDSLVYDPNKWSQKRQVLADVKQQIAKEGLNITQVQNPETGLWESPKLSALEKIPSLAGTGEDVASLRPDVENLTKPQVLAGVQKLLDDSMEMMNNGDKLEFPSSMYSVDSMNREARLTYLFNKYNEAMRSYMSEEKLKNIESINQAISKGLNKIIKNPKRAEAILNAYDIYRGLFVSSKISSLSPSSIIYAAIGNPTMKLMKGFDMLHPDNFTRMKDALAIVAGGNKKRAESVMNWMLSDPMMTDLWQRRSEDFVNTFGIDLSRASLRKEAARKIAEEEKLATEAKDVGMPKDAATIALNQEAIKNVRELLRPKTEMATGPIKFFEGGFSGYSKLKERARELAKTGTGVKQKLGQALTWYTDRSRDFQKVDQANKLADFMRLVRDGITEPELLKITNNTLNTNTRILPTDIANAIWKGGKKYFVIKPDKAMEIVNDTYMNYAAMPAFIKSLRVLPIVGSPFFAFTYAMLAKVGKTALSNPAAFNKINFLLQELSGSQSPLEREALKSKYYSYLNTPGMVNLGESLPFFNKYDIYGNLAQMVPYYSLNIMNPSQRGFNDDIRSRFASVIDNLPVFKDPIGQTLMDYVVLPAIIRDQAPTNMFGTPLYEKNATTAMKMAYAGRSLLESLTPSVPSAVVASFPGLPDEMIKWLPSYPGRKVGYAERGKTAMGLIGNEDPASRGLRAWLSLYGINLYPVDLTNIATEVKNRTLR
jgi:hypothetical protein